MAHVWTFLLEQNRDEFGIEYAFIYYVVGINELDEFLSTHDSETVRGLMASFEYSLSTTHASLGN